MKKLLARADKSVTVQPVLEKLNIENRELLHLAKRACASYLRGVHIMKDKDVFDVTKIDTAKLASSYGLINAPQVTIVPKNSQNQDGIGASLKGADRIAMLRMKAEQRKMQK